MLIITLPNQKLLPLFPFLKLQKNVSIVFQTTDTFFLFDNKFKINSPQIHQR